MDDSSPFRLSETPEQSDRDGVNDPFEWSDLDSMCQRANRYARLE
jgi:hypothetical protein